MSRTFDDVPAASPRRTSRLTDLLWQPLVWAIPFALFFGTLWNADGAGYWLAYRISVIFSFTIRLATVVAERFLVPRLRAFVNAPAGRYPWWREGGLFALVSVSASLLAAFIVDRWVEPAFLQNGRSWSVAALYSMAFTLLVGGIIYARIFYRVSVERARQVERMRAELAAAELRALRAQVHPHFLFNTLNTIAALIGEDPRAAEDIVTRLADVFRHSLAATTGEHARFADELDFLRSYLAIEKARLGARLRFEEAIEPGLESVPVPGLLLQPLLENAVRYAVAERETGGSVRLAAAREGESLRVTIADDGPGFRPGAPPHGHGVGLESVRERLRLAGEGHGLAIDSEPGRGTRVTVTLPLRPSPAAATAPARRAPEELPCD